MIPICGSSTNAFFIPKYDEVFKEVLRRYHDDVRAEGSHSYDYKLASGRVKKYEIGWVGSM